MSNLHRRYAILAAASVAVALLGSCGPSVKSQYEARLALCGKGTPDAIARCFSEASRSEPLSDEPNDCAVHVRGVPSCDGFNFGDSWEKDVCADYGSPGWATGFRFQAFTASNDPDCYGGAGHTRLPRSKQCVDFGPKTLHGDATDLLAGLLETDDVLFRSDKIPQGVSLNLLAQGSVTDAEVLIDAISTRCVHDRMGVIAERHRQQQSEEEQSAKKAQAEKEEQQRRQADSQRRLEAERKAANYKSAIAACTETLGTDPCSSGSSNLDKDQAATCPDDCKKAIAVTEDKLRTTSVKACTEGYVEAKGARPPACNVAHGNLSADSEVLKRITSECNATCKKEAPKALADARREAQEAAQAEARARAQQQAQEARNGDKCRRCFLSPASAADGIESWCDSKVSTSEYQSFIGPLCNSTCANQVAYRRCLSR
jgi:hypothetical protein